MTDGVADAEFSTAAIAWQPVEVATEYQVQIGHVVENAPTYSLPILTRRLSGLTLPLASLPQRTPTALEHKYSVRVIAFDAEGRLLTDSRMKPESSLDPDDRVFKLTGATRLDREQRHVGSRGTEEVISAEYELNDVRLELAENLLPPAAPRWTGSQYVGTCPPSVICNRPGPSTPRSNWRTLRN